MIIVCPFLIALLTYNLKDEAEEASDEDVPEEGEESVRSDDAISRLRLPKEAALANGVIANVGNCKPLIVRAIDFPFLSSDTLCVCISCLTLSLGVH